MRKIMSAAFLVLLAVIIGSASAGPREARQQDYDHFILESLNLSAAQMEKVRSLRAAYLKEKEPLRTRLYSLRMELKLLWMQTQADPVKIKSKQKEVHDLKWQLKEKTTDYRLAFREILTPEQLSKYIVLQHDFKHRKGKGKRGW